MASIKKSGGQTGSFDLARRHFKGSLYLQRRGDKIVAVAWPPKRPGWSNPTNVDQREGMKTLAVALKNINEYDAVGARYFANGSAYAWRDVIARSMLGRFIVLAEEDWMTIQELLEQLSSTPGALARRGLLEWEAITPPASDKILGFKIATGLPDWEDAPASGGGLWGSMLPATPPTMAGTGISNLLNMTGLTAADNTLGFGVVCPPAAIGTKISGIYGAAPSGTWNRTILLASMLNGGNNTSWTCGFYDGTNKLTLITGRFGNAQQMGVSVQNWNSPTSYNGQLVAEIATNIGQFCWVRISGNSTTVTLEFSADGAIWVPLTTITKSSGFLGSGGYVNLFLGLQPQNGQANVNALAWS